MSDQRSLFDENEGPVIAPAAARRAARAKAPKPPPAEEAPREPTPPSALPPQAPPEDLSVGPRCVSPGCDGVFDRCAFHKRDPPPRKEAPPEPPRAPDQGWVVVSGIFHYLRRYVSVCGFDALAFPAAVERVEPAGPGAVGPRTCSRCWIDAGACIRCKVPAGCNQHGTRPRALTPAEMGERS